MPHGILILTWNERSGLELIAEYPKKVKKKITKETLLQVFNMHEFSREAGFVSMSTNDANFASYFLGPERSIYVVLINTLLENPEEFEDILKELAPSINKLVENGKIEENLPEIYEGRFKT